MSETAQRFTVLKAQAGDRAALEELLVTLQDPLHRYLLRLAGNDQLAEDLLQDVLLLLCRKLIWLRDPDLLRPWAYRIASRTAFRRLRRERSRREEPLDTAADVAVPVLEEGIDPELVAQVYGLSPASRAVITLHYLEEFPLSEISAILDIPLGTVKSRLGYGIAQLRRSMGGSA